MLPWRPSPAVSRIYISRVASLYLKEINDCRDACLKAVELFNFGFVVNINKSNSVGSLQAVELK